MRSAHTSSVLLCLGLCLAAAFSAGPAMTAPATGAAGRFGFIDAKGELVIPPCFVGATERISAYLQERGMLEP